MDASLRTVYDRIIHQNHDQTRDAERAAADIGLEIGTQVLVLEHAVPVGLKAKLRRRWAGPYVIREKTGSLSYVVESHDGLQVLRAHREHLKPVMHLRLREHLKPVMHLRLR